MADECAIDPAELAAFAAALLDRLERSHHPVQRSLLAGLAGTARGLLARTVLDDPAPAARTDPDRWTRLCDDHLRSMPS